MDQHLLPPRAERGRIAMNQAELERWGESLGRSSRPPLIVAISGELGAGKTTLAQAICRGYGVTVEVTSPTYALVHEYPSELGPVFHLDLYRLERSDELTNLGWDDIVATDALILVEWPERAGNRLPHDALHLQLEHLPEAPDRRVLLAG